MKYIKAFKSFKDFYEEDGFVIFALKQESEETAATVFYCKVPKNTSATATAIQAYSDFICDLNRTGSNPNKLLEQAKLPDDFFSKKEVELQQPNIANQPALKETEILDGLSKYSKSKSPKKHFKKQTRELIEKAKKITSLSELKKAILFLYLDIKANSVDSLSTSSCFKHIQKALYSINHQSEHCSLVEEKKKNNYFDHLLSPTDRLLTSLDLFHTDWCKKNSETIKTYSEAQIEKMASILATMRKHINNQPPQKKELFLEYFIQPSWNNFFEKAAPEKNSPMYLLDLLKDERKTVCEIFAWGSPSFFIFLPPETKEALMQKKTFLEFLPKLVEDITIENFETEFRHESFKRHVIDYFTKTDINNLDPLFNIAKKISAVCLVSIFNAGGFPEITSAESFNKFIDKIENTDAKNAFMSKLSENLIIPAAQKSLSLVLQDSLTDDEKQKLLSPLQSYTSKLFFFSRHHQKDANFFLNTAKTINSLEKLHEALIVFRLKIEKEKKEAVTQVKADGGFAKAIGVILYQINAFRHQKPALNTPLSRA